MLRLFTVAAVVAAVLVVRLDAQGTTAPPESGDDEGDGDNGGGFEGLDSSDGLQGTFYSFDIKFNCDTEDASIEPLRDVVYDSVKNLGEQYYTVDGSSFDVFAAESNPEVIEITETDAPEPEGSTTVRVIFWFQNPNAVANYDWGTAPQYKAVLESIFNQVGGRALFWSSDPIVHPDSAGTSEVCSSAATPANTVVEDFSPPTDAPTDAPTVSSAPSAVPTRSPTSTQQPAPPFILAPTQNPTTSAPSAAPTKAYALEIITVTNPLDVSEGDTVMDVTVSLRCPSATTSVQYVLRGVLQIGATTVNSVTEIPSASCSGQPGNEQMQITIPAGTVPPADSAKLIVFFAFDETFGLENWADRLANDAVDGIVVVGTSAAPSAVSSGAPSATPTAVESSSPSVAGSAAPSAAGSAAPSAVSSGAPSATPTAVESSSPSVAGSAPPSAAGSAPPSASTSAPTTSPTEGAQDRLAPPTDAPTEGAQPTDAPTEGAQDRVVPPTSAPACEGSGKKGKKKHGKGKKGPVVSGCDETEQSNPDPVEGNTGKKGKVKSKKGKMKSKKGKHAEDTSQYDRTPDVFGLVEEANSEPSADSRYQRRGGAP